MGIHIVTGYAGKEHVTSADAGSMNAGIVGTGRYVMQTAEQFAAEIVSNNLIKVKSGDLMNQGRHMRIDVNDYEEVTIQNGAQSVFRNDLIVARYKKDPSTLIETTEIVVIKGTAGANCNRSDLHIRRHSGRSNTGRFSIVPRVIEWSEHRKSYSIIQYSAESG